MPGRLIRKLCALMLSTRSPHKFVIEFTPKREECRLHREREEETVVCGGEKNAKAARAWLWQKRQHVKHEFNTTDRICWPFMHLNFIKSAKFPQN